MIETQKYRIAPGSTPDLQQLATKENGGLTKKDGKALRRALRESFSDLQERLFAERKQGLLVVFQAMDAAGKNSATKRVFRYIDPAGISAKNFKSPTSAEREHDFLWRIHAHTPLHGNICVFNRSHYEDVVTVRVRKLVADKQWQNRFEHINAFERLLSNEGTIVIKFFLHVSKDYQKERLQRRLNRHDKHWKFDPKDLEDRKRWDAYMHAYSETIQRCSTSLAPWYVVPAERRWYRDLIILTTIIETLEAQHLAYPKPDSMPSRIDIP